MLHKNVFLPRSGTFFHMKIRHRHRKIKWGEQINRSCDYFNQNLQGSVNSSTDISSAFTKHIYEHFPFYSIPFMYLFKVVHHPTAFVNSRSFFPHLHAETHGKIHGFVVITLPAVIHSLTIMIFVWIIYPQIPCPTILLSQHLLSDPGSG